LSEHAPRFEKEQLFPDEVQRGFDIERLLSDFENYCLESNRLQKKYRNQIDLLRGFEAEFVNDSYTEKMLDIRKRHDFQYMIGSVHHLRERPIDIDLTITQEVVEECGGVEAFAIEYYQTVEQMVGELRPDIVAHLDLVKKFGDKFAAADSSRVQEQLERTLEAVEKHDCLLDLNVYPFRKGMKEPYPAPWIVEKVKQTSIEFCFGDDSHSVDSVAVGLAEGREFLMGLGVESVTILRSRSDISFEKQSVPL
jgi:histidinol-phosphatase (PHP family)